MVQKEVDWDVVKNIILDKDSGMMGLRKITELRRGLQLRLQTLRTGSSMAFSPQTVQPNLEAQSIADSLMIEEPEASLAELSDATAPGPQHPASSESDLDSEFEALM